MGGRDGDDVIGVYVGDRREEPRVGYPIGTAWYWVFYDTDVRWQEYPPGLGWWLPADFRVRVEDGALLPNDLTVHVRLHEGVPRCERLELLARKTKRSTVVPTMPTWSETAPITSKGLRRIPITEIMRTCVLAALARRPANGDPSVFHEQLEDWAALYASGDDRAVANRRGKQLGDDHYRAVASTYRGALKAGLPPLKEISARFHVSGSTAGRWVVETRRRGFLGPATPGRAGENRPEEIEP